MQIGLFFGSFNPIHNGHLILAQTALNEAKLDYIWLVVSPQNPFKLKKNLLPEYDRFRMVELAVEGHPRLQASNVEFSLPRPSFTIDTLTHLREVYESYTFSLIMGADNLQQIHRWKNYEALLKYYPIYVYPRVNSELDAGKAYPQVQHFDAPLLNLSATYIRNLVQHKKSIHFMVPTAVQDYIETEALFR